mmetsp:Transcript_18335/g.45952  ORF Transcript_18335/g.45952 Transcript_18335/m.45952 type:complete len:92 (+) Transcript_18335:2426-2701(+)
MTTKKERTRRETKAKKKWKRRAKEKAKSEMEMKMRKARQRWKLVMTNSSQPKYQLCFALASLIPGAVLSLIHNCAYYSPYINSHMCVRSAL